MLTSAEQAALKSFHGPNLYITILGAVAMIVAAAGLKSSAATLISFGVMIGSLIWSNGKLSTTMHSAVHSKNFWTVVGTALVYVASRVFGVALPSGLVPMAATLVTSFIVGNTVRKPVVTTAAAGASSTPSASSGSTTTEGG